MAGDALLATLAAWGTADPAVTAAAPVRPPGSPGDAEDLALQTWISRGLGLALEHALWADEGTWASSTRPWLAAHWPWPLSWILPGLFLFAFWNLVSYLWRSTLPKWGAG